MTRTPRPSLAAVLAALTFLPLSGCGRQRAPIEPREDIHPWPQIMLSDRDLARRLVVRQPIVERDEAGLLYVMVPLRTTTEKQLTIEYRSTFYDRNRTPIFQSTWFPKTMTPFTQDTIQVHSASNRAVDFQVDIRPAK